MYVIGRNDYDFIKIIRRPTVYDGQKIYPITRALEYSCPLHQATVIPCIDEAEELLKEVQENAETVIFSNHSVIGEILDKKHSFDKVEYSKELKIYQLVPIEVTE